MKRRLDQLEVVQSAMIEASGNASLSKQKIGARVLFTRAGSNATAFD